jgi:tRNA(Arg) A34 adenosine deaminase TadA
VTDFAQRTIELARQNVAEGGRPFATVIVKHGKVLAESANRVAQTNDSTAHAEILAIREACVKLGTEHLVDCTIYVIAHPCPMCLGSLYYCSPKEVIFLVTRESYGQYYLDDRKYFEVSTFYDERKELGPAASAHALRASRRRGGCLPVLERAQRRPA